MRAIDTIGNKLCNSQGDIFASYEEIKKGSSLMFIRHFVNSDIARMFDDLSIINLIVSDEDAVIEIESKYEKEGNRSGLRYGKDKMFWIGYIYRYWCYTYEKTSKSVYKLVKPQELASLYLPYHSLDPSQAIERIIEAKRVGGNSTLEDAVSIYRNLVKLKCNK